MPYLDRDGLNIYYEDHGQGPAILLSHGYSATSRMWAGQIAALAPRYRVVVWDMRGHGESDCPEDPAGYSEALTVEDMTALLRKCGIERAVIGGLSLGGYMSLAFHLAHPEMLRALMLFDTGPGFRNARLDEPGTSAHNSAPMTSRPEVSPRSVRATRFGPAGTARRWDWPALHAACWPRQMAVSSIHSTKLPSRAWSWSAPTIRIFSPPPITWPAKSQGRCR